MAPSVPSQSPPTAPRPRRGLAALTGLLLALLTALALAAPAAQAAPPATEDPAEAAAGWLARQLADGSHFEAVFDGVAYPDAGLTLDAVLAFAAADVAGGSADKAMAWVGQPENLATYIGNGTTDSYPGALAKLSLAAQVQGLDPESFGTAGVDLPARLQALLTPSGRFSDKSSFEPYVDYSNAFGQSYAILTLERAGGAPASAVDYLAKSECDAGGFPLEFEKPTCTPDTDATAQAVQALLAAGATEAAGSGIGWLLEQQQPDGSFGGGTSTEGANANSTGLAAQALGVAGEAAAARRAAGYLRKLQSGCATPPAQRGAVAYDAAGFQADSAPRATAQAVLGLVGIGLAELDGTDGAAEAPVLACAAAPSSPAPSTPAPTPSTAAPTTPTPTTPAPATPAPTKPTATGAPAPTIAPVAPVGPPAGPPGYGGTLPATGTDPKPVAWLGGALLLVGAVLAATARRRRPTSS